jgi:hypothetical protein
MKEALVIVMLVLLVAPLLIGIRRVRRVLDRTAEDGGRGEEKSGR